MNEALEVVAEKGLKLPSGKIFFKHGEDSYLKINDTFEYLAKDKEVALRRAKPFLTEEDFDFIILQQEKEITQKGKPLVLRDFKYLNTLKKDKSYIVDKFIYPQTVNMLYSPPGGFKSLIASYLAMAITQGKPFFGMETKKQGVLLCDKENGEQRMKTNLEGIFVGQGYTRKTFPLKLLIRNGDLQDEAFIEKLKEATMENKIKLIVFDTLHRFADYEENKADDLNRLYTNVFQPLVDECNTSILFLHHSNKGKAGEYRGSIDLLGMVDAAYKVQREKKTNKFTLSCTKARGGEIDELPGEIDFAEDGSYIKFNKLDSATIKADKENKISRLKEVQNKIWAMFKRKGDLIERADIKAALNLEGCIVSDATVKRVLKYMVDKDYLSNENRGQYIRIMDTFSAFEDGNR